MKLLSKLVFVGALLFSVLYTQNSSNVFNANIENTSETINSEESSITIDKETSNNIKKEVITSDVFSAGDGSETSPYIISSPEKFKTFSKSIINGTFTKSMMVNKYFKIDDTLTSMTLTYWIPLGNETYPFYGNFDGSNCEITYKILINNNDLWNNNSLYIGLFGYVIGGGSCSIKNVVIFNPWIAVSSYPSSGSIQIYSGFLAGYCEDTGIQNCKITSNLAINLDFNLETNLIVTNAMYCGGLVGFYRFKNFTNNAMIKCEVNHVICKFYSYTNAAKLYNVFLGGNVGLMSIYYGATFEKIIIKGTDFVLRTKVEVDNLHYGGFSGHLDWGEAHIKECNIIYNKFVALSVKGISNKVSSLNIGGFIGSSTGVIL